jgi:putative ABC transport system substrate-binding protein
VLPSPFFYAHRGDLIELIAKHRLPAMFEFKDYVQEGGLISYGPSIIAMHRSMASYVVRILKGAKPGDLPIERATSFELVLNLRTAKTLGLTIPPPVLVRATEIIQ